MTAIDALWIVAFVWSVAVVAAHAAGLAYVGWRGAERVRWWLTDGRGGPPRPGCP